MVGKLEDYLARELSRTGYPLEIEISSILGKEYLVWNNEYFLDWDTNEAREIDISATPTQYEHKYAYEKIKPFSISHRLAIECKKSETHAWIFLTRPERMVRFQGQCMDFLNLATRNALANFVDEILSTCKKYLHYYSFERVASTHAEIKYQGQKSTKSEIFEARNQLVKFVDYDIVQLLKRLKSVGFNPATSHLIMLYHPTIVFDGKLYEAIIENGSPKLFERKHLLLSSNYSPKYVKDFPETESPELPYLIDVVRRDFFADFLQILEKDYSTLWNCISTNVEELSDMAKEYLKDISRS